MNAFLAKWASANEVDEAENNHPVEARGFNRFLPDIGNMAVSEFATAGLVVKLRSSLLGGQVVAFASDNAKIEDGELVTYRASELALLSDVSDDDLVRLHSLKRVFTGSLVERVAPVSKV